MEFRQLEMFVAVLEAGSVQRAAERVFRTSPAVSMAIRKLEDDVGVALFERAERGDFTPTQAGESLYRHARKLLRGRDEALLELDELKTLDRGRLRLGAIESSASYLLPSLTQSFRAQYPNIRLEVACDTSDALVNSLRSRKIELALLAFAPTDEEIDSRCVVRDEVVAIVGPGHALAGAESVGVRELRTEFLIVESVASKLRERLAEVFEAHKTPLNVAVEGATIETVKKLVARDQGVGFVPAMCIQDELARGELVRLPLEGFRHERELWVAWRCRGARSEAAEAFLKVVVSLAEPARREPRVRAAR
jgi:DNA-binding transcriptional LysR family regulator